MSSKFIVQSAAGYDHFMGDGASGSLRCLSTLPGFMMAIGDIRRGELRLKMGPPLLSKLMDEVQNVPGVSPQPIQFEKTSSSPSRTNSKST